MKNKILNFALAGMALFFISGQAPRRVELIPDKESSTQQTEVKKEVSTSEKPKMEERKSAAQKAMEMDEKKESDQLSAAKRAIREEYILSQK